MSEGASSTTATISSTTVTAGTSPSLASIGGAGAATIDGGTTGGRTLSGGVGRDAFVLHAGAANGDTITNFDTNLSTGDFLELAGYGTGAALTQVDATTWTTASASGSIHDQIHFNAPSLVPANFLFA